jgi:hypothetical protein
MNVIDMRVLPCVAGGIPEVTASSPPKTAAFQWQDQTIRDNRRQRYTGQMARFHAADKLRGPLDQSNIGQNLVGLIPNFRMPGPWDCDAHWF